MQMAHDAIQKIIEAQWYQLNKKIGLVDSTSDSTSNSTSNSTSTTVSTFENIPEEENIITTVTSKFAEKKSSKISKKADIIEKVENQ